MIVRTENGDYGKILHKRVEAKRKAFFGKNNCEHFQVHWFCTVPESMV